MLIRRLLRLGSPAVRRTPRLRLGDEAGFAVPVVMGALVTAFAIASVTITAVLPAHSGTVRDQDVKEALAAAEAGVNEALLHFNRIAVTDTAPGPCIAGAPAARTALADGTLDPDGQKWCAGVQRQFSAVPGATYTYWVRPNATQGTLEIVSLGEVSGVSRKVEVIARSSSGIRPFGAASVMGLNFLNMDSLARITADVATNGDLTLDANASLTCGYAQVGLGRQITGSGNATCSPTEDTLSLPPVNQGDVATNNSNYRITTGEDTATGNPPIWDANTRHLSLKKQGGNETTLTLGGENYSLCTLTLESNTSLFIAGGADVRIYFDSPEACGLPDGAVQLSVASNSGIYAAGDSSVALLFVGSDDLRTTAILSSNTQANEACEQDFVVYGPRTDLIMNSNSYFCGALAGRSITLKSNADIKTNNLATNFELPNTVLHHYAAEEFRDCAATPATPTPDYGC